MTTASIDRSIGKAKKHAEEEWPEPQTVAAVREYLLAFIDHHGRPRRIFPTKPNEKCLTGVTEHQTAEGKLGLCAIKECYSERIVGYSIDSRMKASLGSQRSATR
ncbi:MAG: hypothetical protein H7201_18850 [Candidatus Saccharibacteria bacterium]|nr:hypothetical protein [Microbacteriaceae bacterium]